MGSTCGLTDAQSTWSSSPPGTSVASTVVDLAIPHVDLIRTSCLQSGQSHLPAPGVASASRGVLHDRHGWAAKELVAQSRRLRSSCSRISATRRSSQRKRVPPVTVGTTACAMLHQPKRARTSARDQRPSAEDDAGRLAIATVVAALVHHVNIHGAGHRPDIVRVSRRDHFETPSYAEADRGHRLGETWTSAIGSLAERDARRNGGHSQARSGGHGARLRRGTGAASMMPAASMSGKPSGITGAHSPASTRTEESRSPARAVVQQGHRGRAPAGGLATGPRNANGRYGSRGLRSAAWRASPRGVPTSPAPNVVITADAPTLITTTSPVPLDMPSTLGTCRQQTAVLRGSKLHAPSVVYVTTIACADAQ